MYELMGLGQGTDALALGVRILEVVFGFGLIIFVHEVGHFIVAKRAGVLVERFSLGFGPRLIGFTRGETEYRISLIPLGGYVKLSGEHPGSEKKPGPRDLAAQSPGVRAAIFAAGSLMNAIVALPLLWCMYWVGLTVAGPVVGYVREGSQAESAGLRPGDRILSLSQESVKVWEDVTRTFSASPGRTLSAQVRRVDGANATISLSVAEDGQPQFQEICYSALGSVPAGSVAGKAGVRGGDEILSVNGVPFSGGDDPRSWYSSFSDVWMIPPLRPVSLLVRRSGRDLSISVPKPATRGAWVIGARIYVPAVVSSVQKGSPAEAAGLVAGDRIAAVDGVKVRDWLHMSRLIRTASGPVAMEVWREGAASPLELSVNPKAANAGLGNKQVGVAGGPPQVYAVEPGWPAGPAGIEPGDFIVAVRGEDPESGRTREEAPRSEEHLHAILERFAGQAVVVDVERAGRKLHVQVRPVLKPYGSLGIDYRIPYVAETKHRGGVVEALLRGTQKFIELCRQTGVILKGLFTGLISTRHVSGPAGIVAFSYEQAREGLGHLLGFLALISMNLAVVNMFPIPILDGGHILFLIVEKVKGRPVSERGMVVAQYMGLAIILLVFVFATRNDIGLIGSLLGNE